MSSYTFDTALPKPVCDDLCRILELFCIPLYVINMQCTYVHTCGTLRCTYNRTVLIQFYIKLYCAMLHDELETTWSTQVSIYRCMPNTNTHALVHLFEQDDRTHRDLNTAYLITFHSCVCMKSYIFDTVLPKTVCDDVYRIS